MPTHCTPSSLPPQSLHKTYPIQRAHLTRTQYPTTPPPLQPYLPPLFPYSPKPPFCNFHPSTPLQSPWYSNSVPIITQLHTTPVPFILALPLCLARIPASTHNVIAWHLTSKTSYFTCLLACFQSHCRVDGTITAMFEISCGTWRGRGLEVIMPLYWLSRSLAVFLHALGGYMFEKVLTGWRGRL